MSGYTQHEMQRVDSNYTQLVHMRNKMYEDLTKAFQIATSKEQRDAMRALVATARELGRCEALNGVES